MEHLLPAGHVLVSPVVEQVIEFPVLRCGRGAAAQHRDIESGKVGPGGQHRHHHHIPHGLASLELHHAGGDQVPVAAAAPPPAVDYRVEEDHVEAGQGGQIEQGRQGSGGVPVKDQNKKFGGHIAQKAARRQQDDAQRTVPPGDRTDGLRLPGLVDHVQDVGPPQKAAQHNKQHDNHKEGEGQGQQIGMGVKGQGHLL